jgi:hypothetical protein
MAKDRKAADQPGGIAEQAMEQARRSADTYCDYVKQAIAATPSGGNEFAERIKGYAEKNITMTQEYLRQLSQARNFQDMVRIQADFIQSLMKAFGEQSLGEACSSRYGEEAYVRHVVTRRRVFSAMLRSFALPRFYEPDLGADPNNPFREMLLTNLFDGAIGWTWLFPLSYW